MKTQTTWRKVAFNIQNIAFSTVRATKINMPHSSEHDGYSFWVSNKLLREGRHSYEFLLSIKSDMTFNLNKHNKKNEVIAFKTLNADELAVAFGGWVDDAPRYSKPAIDPDKEEIVKHVPAPLAPVDIEADPELVR